MGCQGPRPRRGVHRDGLEEPVISSSGRLTFFGSVRSQSRSHQLPPSVSRSQRHSLQSTSVRATQIPTPRPTSLTSAVILRVCTGSLAAAHKGHSRARHFGAIFTFLVQICFACGAQQAVHHLLASLHLGGGQCSNLGASARYARARIELFALPEGILLLGISATSGSFGSAGAEHSKACGAPGWPALTVAALASICSAFRLLACRCTVH